MNEFGCNRGWLSFDFFSPCRLEIGGSNWNNLRAQAGWGTTAGLVGIIYIALKKVNNGGL